MTWFGWLTKGKCEVSALDGLTFAGELIFAIVICFLIIYGLSRVVK